VQCAHAVADLGIAEWQYGHGRIDGESWARNMIASGNARMKIAAPNIHQPMNE
jgi:hypothetical protein